MRVDLFIHLLDAKKRTIKASSASASAVSYSNAKSIAGGKTDETGYSIDLSFEALKQSKRLAYQIRDENEQHSLAQGHGLTSSPHSLSSEIQKPLLRFDELVQTLEQNPQKLLEAHGEVDRQLSLKLLGS